VSNQDQARLVAQRVAQRIQGTVSSQAPKARGPENGSPVREELSAIREGLHDLENKLDRIESKIGEGHETASAAARARVIDFVSSGPPIVKAPEFSPAQAPTEEPAPRTIATTSPWLAGISGQYQTPASNRQSPIGNWQSSHPSQERFGVEEATVSELVEFFENEKKCALDPSGKPCDHCAMCSSRGF
jgi:hypothetical protein